VAGLGQRPAAVEKPAPDDDARAHARARSHVNEVGHAPARPEAVLAERRQVGVVGQHHVEAGLCLQAPRRRKRARLADDLRRLGLLSDRTISM